MSTESKHKISKQEQKKETFRADVNITGEPAEQANEMLDNGIFGNKTELVRQGIRYLYYRWKSSEVSDES
ncbi:MAG: hypothetical protein GF308_11740 [Candidatus Heimdallarchaeota archaeon]|nr:hypothetical protein [Candidatus Heimdallarchaeota archaeon]